MVDVATYQLMHRLTAKVVGEDEISKFDVWPSKINRQDELPPKMALLLPATTFGFDLHSKRWGITARSIIYLIRTQYS